MTFRDPEKKFWPQEINELTAAAIIVNAVEEHIGGEALDSEMAADNEATVQALRDMERLVEVLWTLNVRGYYGGWDGLVRALERSLQAKKDYIGAEKRHFGLNDLQSKDSLRKEVYGRQ